MWYGDALLMMSTVGEKYAKLASLIAHVFAITKELALASLFAAAIHVGSGEFARLVCTGVHAPEIKKIDRTLALPATSIEIDKQAVVEVLRDHAPLVLPVSAALAPMRMCAHSLTHSLAHSLTHSLTHPLSLALSPMHAPPPHRCLPRRFAAKTPARAKSRRCWRPPT